VSNQIKKNKNVYKYLPVLFLQGNTLLYLNRREMKVFIK